MITKDETLITQEWLELNGFKLTKPHSYEHWRRTDDEGYYLDWLILMKHEIASFYTLWIDYKDIRRISGNEVRYFHKQEIIDLWKLLVGVDLKLEKDEI